MPRGRLIERGAGLVDVSCSTEPDGQVDERAVVAQRVNRDLVMGRQMFELGSSEIDDRAPERFAALLAALLAALRRRPRSAYPRGPQTLASTPIRSFNGSNDVIFTGKGVRRAQ